MRDSSLKLQDKTVFLTGPFNGITQSIIRGLAEHGADVAFVSDTSPNASRFTDGVNENREIYPNHGRTAHLNLSLKSPEHVQEAIGRVAESLGRMDILVNALPLSWDGQTALSTVGEICSTLIEKFTPFFQAKQRGRVIYIFEDEALGRIGGTSWPDSFRQEFLDQVVRPSAALRTIHATVNALSLGITEDFLLKTFPKSPSIKMSLDTLTKSHPGSRLVESADVAAAVAFLSSPNAGSITGQRLRLTHGL